MKTITPDEARQRFGELLHAGTRTYREFDDSEGGIWRPVFVERELIGYRVYRLTKLPKRFSPRSRRQ